MRVVRALDAAMPDVDAFLAQHGLLRSQLTDPYAAIPLRPYSALLEAAAARTGDRRFGLRIGAALQPADLGPAGLLLMSAPTLRRGLERFDRYIATVQSGTQVGLQDHGASVGWVYRVEDPAVWPRIQDSELTMAGICSFLRARLGAKWSPLEVHLEHAGADTGQTLQDFFRAKVLFDQPMTQILVSSVDLDRELMVEGADATSALERHAQDILARLADDQKGPGATLTDRVNRLIGARLGVEPVTVASVARAFGLSARSLQRDLADEGTSLRDLLRAHRRMLAERRLDSGASSHAAIAQAMGYSDSTVFWRAFKRWSGKSPRAFRHRADD
jgi:AraC-like DNA-binding protein